MTQATAYATVEVTVQIYVGTWGTDGNLEEMSKQVRREGAETIREMIQYHGGRIIGEPKVKSVTFKEGPEVNND